MHCIYMYNVLELVASTHIIIVLGLYPMLKSECDLSLSTMPTLTWAKE